MAFFATQAVSLAQAAGNKLWIPDSSGNLPEEALSFQLKAGMKFKFNVIATAANKIELGKIVDSLRERVEGERTISSINPSTGEITDIRKVVLDRTGTRFTAIADGKFDLTVTFDVIHNPIPIIVYIGVIVGIGVIAGFFAKTSLKSIEVITQNVSETFESTGGKVALATGGIGFLLLVGLGVAVFFGARPRSGSS